MPIRFSRLHVATVILDRPEKMNATDRTCTRPSRTHVLTDSRDDIGLHVTGAGDKAFTAGADSGMHGTAEGAKA